MRISYEQVSAVKTTKPGDIACSLHTTAKPDSVPQKTTQPVGDVTNSQQATNERQQTDQADDVTRAAADAADIRDESFQAKNCESIKAIDTSDIEVHFAKNASMS